MERFFTRTKKIIFAKQKGIFSSSLILSSMIIVSSFFGFLRYRILSGYFTKEELDLFFASFRLPDLIFEILITGALTSTLIPIYIKYQKNKELLEENISSIFNLLLIILLLFSAFLFVFMGTIIPLITPGFSKEKIDIIVFYSQMLLLGQLPFLIVGNFFTGIAQANKTFLLSALAPIIYNLAIIFSTVVFVGKFHLFAPVIGVMIGALLFFLIQLPIIFNLNFRFLFMIKITHGVKEFFRMVVPRIMTVIVTQIDATIDLTLTTFLGAGNYTIFYFAQHLQLLPVSVFGIAYGQASLPYMSELYNEKKYTEFKNIVVNSILSLFFFTIPIMGFFMFARTPLIRLFFGGAKFDWRATDWTAITLSFFALSLPFHSIYYFVVRCFYAVLDSRTPFYVSLFSIGVNTLLSIYFVLFLKSRVWFLAIAFSISITLNVLILLFLLMKKIGGLNLKVLFTETAKICTAMAIASISSYYLMKLMDPLILDTRRTINIFLLLLTSSIFYGMLYLFLSWLLNVKEIFMISDLLRKVREHQKKIVELYINYD